MVTNTGSTKIHKFIVWENTKLLTSTTDLHTLIYILRQHMGSRNGVVHWKWPGFWKIEDSSTFQDSVTRVSNQYCISHCDRNFQGHKKKQRHFKHLVTDFKNTSLSNYLCPFNNLQAYYCEITMLHSLYMILNLHKLSVI